MNVPVTSYESPVTAFNILHHGAVDGVTGSCHELRASDGRALMVDCGLFQGADCSGRGEGAAQLEIDFPVDHVQALVLTHVHIDHAGRIPYLFAAGFDGPVYCSPPTARLLPLVMEDALKVGVTTDRRLIRRVVKKIQGSLRPIPYKEWVELWQGESRLRVRLNPAGHIFGSAFVECDLKTDEGSSRIVFSGDLGAPYTPLLPAPRSPSRADVMVLESTYGDRLHRNRRDRGRRLQAVVERAVADRGVVLIPAFSIGRTQELLYDLEGIIHRNRNRRRSQSRALDWAKVEIIVDSPLASKFTREIRALKGHWDREAHQRLRHGRHPLSFTNMTTIDTHREHLQTVARLKRSAHPSIVIAASGMCTGGRIVNYLKALLGDSRTDVVFVGYQARGTTGRDIQTYGPRHGWVMLGGERVDIAARVHSLSGYSAHADQRDLINFVTRTRRAPQQVRLVHGDRDAKEALAAQLRAFVPDVVVP